MRVAACLHSSGRAGDGAKKGALARLPGGGRQPLEAVPKRLERASVPSRRREKPSQVTCQPARGTLAKDSGYETIVCFITCSTGEFMPYSSPMSWACFGRESDDACEKSRCRTAMEPKEQQKTFFTKLQPREGTCETELLLLSFCSFFHPLSSLPASGTAFIAAHRHTQAISATRDQREVPTRRDWY